MVVDHLFEGDRSHGRVRVHECGAVRLDDTLDLLAGRCLRGATAPDALPLAPTRLVYFDLETTGLSGGAGMVAFLAGVGEWTPDGFRTTQFLLPSFAAERALLHALNAYLGDDAVLVTYNGRTFDVPVMEVRGEMQRVPQVVCSLPHLDMLHAARRLWRMSEEGDRSCRLTHLEESVLGVGRVGDVGGFEIPARYFQFVRGGNAALLEPVLMHNRLDLLSLAALTAHAQRLVCEGREVPPVGSTAFGLGVIYDRGGWVRARARVLQVGRRGSLADARFQARGGALTGTPAAAAATVRGGGGGLAAGAAARRAAATAPRGAGSAGHPSRAPRWTTGRGATTCRRGGGAGDWAGRARAVQSSLGQARAELARATPATQLWTE